MKLAITGCNGRVGQRVVALALAKGLDVLGVDISPSEACTEHDKYKFLCIDLTDYEATLGAIRGCEAIIHLAGYPNPGDYRVKVHNTNVVLSWNVLHAAAELGITRIAQASSVNVLTMVYSQKSHFDYFPIDEAHPCLPDEPYGLSKLICELQADAVIRRYPTMKIASLRLHWSIPRRQVAQTLPPERAKNDLWGYVQQDSAAEAFLLAVTSGDDRWSGHERFFIAAPEIAWDEDSEVLRLKHWAHVPVREGKQIRGQRGFFDCAKAERLLGWVHKDKP